MGEAEREAERGKRRRLMSTFTSFVPAIGTPFAVRLATIDATLAGSMNPVPAPLGVEGKPRRSFSAGILT